MRLSYLLLTASSLLFTQLAGFGQILTYEPFDYAVDATLNGRTGGTGFGGPWLEAQGDYDTIVAGNLAYLHLALSGNSLHSEAPNQFYTDLSRSLAQPITGTTGTTLWVSFLMRKDVSSGPGPDDYFGLVLYPSDSNATSLFIGDTGETDYYSLGEAGSAQGEYASGVTSAVSSSATFLVVKITFQAGADRVDLYINPDPSAAAPTTAAATKSDLDIADINQIGIIAGLDAVWTADEVRIGRSFADIAPLPAIHLTSFGRTNGVVSGSGIGLPFKTYSVQFTDNLTQPFAFLKAATADSSGVLQFQDTPPGAATKRFYRVTYP